MITSTRVGIAIFSAAAVLGPLYTVAEYSAVTNLISELGAQQTENNFIMITAFVILGWLWIKFPDSLGAEERTPLSGVSS